MRNSSLRLVSVAFLAGLGACNTVETGRNGIVEFVPDACGQPGCDLGDRLAVGGLTEVYLQGVKKAKVDDLTLVSSAPWVIDVVTREPGIEPRFQLVGNGSGHADLLAVDQWGYTVDWISVEVAQADGLAISVTGAGVVGPMQQVGVDERYQIARGARVELDVQAEAGLSPLMGDLQYDVQIDEALARSIASGSDVGRGHLIFTAPVGESDLVFTAPGGARRLIRIAVQ